MASHAPYWFRRFADVPGVGYQPPAGVDFAALRFREHEPEIGRSSYDSSVKLDWPERDGEYTSWSPAKDHGEGLYGEELSAGQVLKLLAEALELPAEPDDYHFLLAGAAAGLEGHAERDAALLAELERISWLDVRLVQAREDIIQARPTDDINWLRVPSLARLIRMYEQAGFLREALEVAEIAARYEQDEGRAQTLRERIAVDEALDAA